jgi:gluconolactonase
MAGILPKYIMSQRLMVLLAAALLIQCGRAPKEGAKPVVFEEPAGILIADSDWEPVSTQHFYTDGIAVDADGNIYFVDVPLNQVFRIDASGELIVIDQAADLTKGMMFGPDGRMYACRSGAAQIVAYDNSGQWSTVFEGKLSPVKAYPKHEPEFCNDLVVTSTGRIYFTNRALEQVVLLDTDGSSRVVANGFRPNGITMLPDESRLVVTDSINPKLWAFEIEASGDLLELPDFYDAVVIPTRMGPDIHNTQRPGSNGMTVDTAGRIYVVAHAGVEVFSRAGKLLGVIRKPQPVASNVVLGGPEFNWLYITARDTVYRRRIEARGAPYFLRAAD